jgi:predicted Kef-type K+ transport protein
MSGFGFHTLALLAVIGMAGPLLASLPRFRVPVIIGELVAGLVVGKTGFGIVDHTDATFTLLANIGFALVMFVVGTHVPVRDKTLRSAIPKPVFPTARPAASSPMITGTRKRGSEASSGPAIPMTASSASV